jgi:HEAT repeat protein
MWPDRKRRLLVIGAAAVLAACVLSGCGSDRSARDAEGARASQAPRDTAAGEGSSGDAAAETSSPRGAESYRQLVRLSRQQNPDHLPLFRREATQADWKRRHAAVVGIGRLKEKGDPKLLVETFRNRQERPEVRAAAAEALGAMRYVEAGPDLIDALDDGSELVRNNAAIALRKIMQVDFGYRAGDPPGRRRDIAALIRRKWPEFYASRPYAWRSEK